jgi:hypothetical protein
MNKKQFIFVTLLIIILHFFTIYFCLRVEEWSDISPLTFNKFIAGILLFISVSVDLYLLCELGCKIYDCLD